MDKKLFLENLKKFIAIESDSHDIQKLHSGIRFVQDYFNAMNLSFHMYEKNEKPSIVISNVLTRDFDVILNGHLDVVKTENNIYEMIEAGDELRGRGVADMKSFVLVMADVAKELWEKNLITYKLGIMITADEEVGGFDGVGYLLDEEKYSAHVAVIPDGGKDLHTIEIGSKGLLHLTFEAEGIPGHGSRPWEGENAIEKLLELYSFIKDLIGPNKSDEWGPTYNLGLLQGGKTVNVIPEKGIMKVDIRFTENEDPIHIMSEIEKKAAKNNITVTKNVVGDCVFVPKTNIFMVKYAQSIQNIKPGEINFDRSYGSSDARFFAKHDIPTIIHQATCGGLHTENEWCNTQSLFDYREILKDYLISLNDYFKPKS